MAGDPQYQDAGPGRCQVSGNYPQHIMLNGVDSKESCQSQCSGNDACRGYSYDTVSEGCVLFTESPLSGGGASWNQAHCIIKEGGPVAPKPSGKYSDAGPGTCTYNGGSPS